MPPPTLMRNWLLLKAECNSNHSTHHVSGKEKEDVITQGSKSAPSLHPLLNPQVLRDRWGRAHCPVKSTRIGHRSWVTVWASSSGWWHQLERPPQHVGMSPGTAKDCWHRPEAGQARKGSTQRPRRNQPGNLISDFQSPEAGGRGGHCQLFKPPRLLQPQDIMVCSHRIASPQMPLFAGDTWHQCL